jgi:hypothetical protein
MMLKKKSSRKSLRKSLRKSTKHKLCMNKRSSKKRSKKRKSVLNKRRRSKKNIDGMKTKEQKADEIMVFIKNIEVFKSMPDDFESLVRNFIQNKTSDNIVKIVVSEKFNLYEDKEKQLFFIVLIQQMLVMENFEIDINLFFASPLMTSDRINEDNKQILVYIFEFYVLINSLIKNTKDELVISLNSLMKNDRVLETKDKLKNIIINFFYITNYEKEIRLLQEEITSFEEKTEEERKKMDLTVKRSIQVRKKSRAAGAAGGAPSSAFTNVSSSIYKTQKINQKIMHFRKKNQETEILIDVYKFFEYDELELYLMLYKKIINCLSYFFSFSDKRKVVEGIIAIYSRIIISPDEDPLQPDLFFLIFFLKFSGYTFGTFLGKLQYNLSPQNHNTYVIFSEGNKLRTEKRLGLKIKPKTINHIVDIFYVKDEDDHYIHDSVIIKEEGEIDDILKQIFTSENYTEHNEILMILFNFLFVKYSIIFNLPEIYIKGDIFSLYESNIKKIMLFFKSINKFLSDRFKDGLFIRITSYIQTITSFHNYQLNIYTNLFEGNNQIQKIKYDISRRYYEKEKEYNIEKKENHLKEQIREKQEKEMKDLEERERLEIIKNLLENEKRAEDKRRDSEKRIKEQEQRIKEQEKSQQQRKSKGTDDSRNKLIDEANQIIKQEKENIKNERIKQKENEMKRKQIEDEKNIEIKRLKDEEKQELKRRKEENDRKIQQEKKNKQMFYENSRFSCLQEAKNYEINLNCFDNIEMINDKDKATYNIFKGLFYNYIAFLTKLLEENELFYVVVVGGSAIEKQCSEYKTNDIDIKFIPYDEIISIKNNDENHEFVMSLLNIFIDKVSELLRTKLSYIYERAKDKFNKDKKELKEYMMAFEKSIVYKEDTKAKKDEVFSINIFKKSITDVEVLDKLNYEKIVIDLNVYKNKHKSDFYRLLPQFPSIDYHTMMDVSFHQNNRGFKKLLKKTEELMHEKNKKVPKLLIKDGLNIAHLDYLLKEKELLINSNYLPKYEQDIISKLVNDNIQLTERGKQAIEFSSFISLENKKIILQNILSEDDKKSINKSLLQNNFIELKNIEDEDERLERFNHVKNKSRNQYEILLRCQQEALLKR